MSATVETATTWRAPAWAVGAGVVAAVLAQDPKVGLAAAVAVPFALLTSMRTKVAAYFLLLPVVGFAKVRLPATPIQALPEAIAVLLVLQLIWDSLTTGAEIVARRAYAFFVALFAVLVIVQARNPIVVAGGVSGNGLRVYLPTLVMFFVGSRFFATPDAARLFLKIGVATALVTGLYTLKQLAFGFDSAERTFFTAGASIQTLGEKKLFSTFSSPDGYAFASVLFVLVCLAARSAGVWPRMATLGAALSVIGALASGIRIALVALVLGSALVLWLELRDPRTRLLGLRMSLVATTGVVILTAAVVAAPAPARRVGLVHTNPVAAAVNKLALLKRVTGEQDVQSRIQRIHMFIGFIDRHPLGEGTGVVSLVNQRETAAGKPQRPTPAFLANAPFLFQGDFNFMSVGAELGYPGLLLLILLLLVGARLGVLAWHRVDDTTERALLTVAAAAPILALVVNLTNSSFRTPEVAGYVWFLIGASVAYLSRERARRAATP